jgi:hypothetical protein
LRIGAQGAQFFLKLLALLFVLTLGAGLRHAQMKVQFMQPANGSAVTQFHAQLLLQIAVKFDARPVDLAG